MSRNTINDALEASIRGEEFTAEGGTAKLFFAADFAGFEGHFEGAPVVPGVCLIQAFALLCRRKTGRALYVANLKQAKFLRPVLPETTVDFEFKLTPEQNGRFSCKGSAGNTEGKIAKVSMELEYA